MIKIQRNSKGFTLIELLIVVAIIGILAAVAIPAYSGYTKKAKIAGVVHAMGGIKTAVAAYATEAGNTVDAGSAALIKTTYGVDVPTQYATFAYTAGGRVITASIQGVGGADVDGTNLTLTGDVDFKTWAWGGTIPTSYMPKN